MTRGGARNRSGPKGDDESLNAAKKGIVFDALPPEGFRGKAPEFPLPKVSEREAEVWSAAWRTPQACAWNVQPWRWSAVAMWVRWSVRLEAPDSSAALGNVVIRFADQIGMTPAGLKENGWKIAPARDEPRATGTTGKPASSRGRLKVVKDDG